MNSRYAFGRLLALGAAACWGLITSFARIVYQEGANPASLTVLRFVLLALTMLMLLVVFKRPLRITVSRKLMSGLILSWYLITAGHLGAVNFIPISLAAVIFYTFPFMVLGYARFVQRKRVTLREASGFIVAFAGLVVALGPVITGLDPVGVGLAFVGALAAATFLVAYERVPDHVDVIAISFWLALGCVVLSLVVALFGRDVPIPNSERAWLALGAIAVFTATAFILNLLAVRRIGAATTSLLLNLEPVVIMCAAVFLVGEHLSTQQIIGIIVVVSGLIVSQWPEKTDKTAVLPVP